MEGCDFLGRTTVYNTISSPELLKQVLPENLELGNDFLEYLQSIDRSKNTIAQYKNDLNIFWCWNLQYNKNKEFVKITKREFSRFQNHALNEWMWSPKRVRRVKSTLSSLSNYIENILDEEPEYEGYRAVIRKIESPANTAVREKTVFTKEELQSLLDHLVEEKKYMQACVLSLAMNSGRRKAELPRFKVSYFDESNVKFGSLYQTPEKVKTKGQGSKGKMLELFVFKKEFDPYLKLWLEERDKLGITSEWLFPAKINDGWDNSKQVTIETLNSWAAQFARYLNKDFYWHSLRHFFTTECIRSNLPASVIQTIVGWESADMVTLYTDLSIEETLGQYFDENGIKVVEQKSLADM